MKQKKNAGYTLIELIVVIAILAILVGIVVKVYVGHVEKSRAAACASNRDELYSEISTEYTAEEYSSLKLAFIGVMDERYNGRILTMKKTDGTINGVTRGDILEYEGEYYVFNDGGEWGVNPDNDTKSQWYKIPK